MFRKILKIGVVFCILTGIVILGEALYFHHILSKSNALEKSDLIVVFAGGADRIKAGYELARLGYAPCLVISPADAKKLKTYDEKNDLPEEVKHLIEDKARSTFENAVFTKKIVEHHGFKSVILVTSFYHLPRSYFLLRVLLMGSGVQIETYGVARKGINGVDLLKSPVGRKRIYNEMLKLWASIVELLSYKLSGSLPEENPKNSRLIEHMQSLFLFNITGDLTPTLKVFPSTA